MSCIFIFVPAFGLRNIIRKIIIKIDRCESCRHHHHHSLPLLLSLSPSNINSKTVVRVNRNNSYVEVPEKKYGKRHVKNTFH